MQVVKLYKFSYPYLGYNLGVIDALIRATGTKFAISAAFETYLMIFETNLEVIT